MECVQDKVKAGRKRACKNVVEPADDKKKAYSETLQRSPLFLTPSSPSKMSSSPGLARSPLFGGKAEKVAIDIDNLTPGSYCNHKILGRVASLTDVVQWNNGRSAGEVASFTILNGKAEISVSLFNAQIEQFHHLLKINQVVQVSGFRVKTIEEKFQKIPGQGLELILDFNGSITESGLDVEPITFNFKDITATNELPVGSLIDMVGIGYEDRGLVEGVSTNGKPFVYKTITITDRTELQYAVKLWGDAARKTAFEKPTVFVLRRGKVEVYENQKYINLSGSSLFWVNPEVKEATELSDWLGKRLSQQ